MNGKLISNTRTRTLVIRQELTSFDGDNGDLDSILVQFLHVCWWRGFHHLLLTKVYVYAISLRIIILNSVQKAKANSDVN